MATINGDPNFTDEEETVVVEKLKEAMDQTGTNEDAIIEILVTHNNFQRRRIAKAFGQAMGKPLDEALKDELSGDFEEVILAMLREPRELDAVMLHDAMAGCGTDERMLIGVLSTRTNAEIDEIKKHYQKLYDSDLTEDLRGETSGYFCRMMYSLCTGFRQIEEADDDYASEQAQKLVDAGVGQLGTDECDFNQVLCLSSFSTLRKVFDKYREIRGAELEDDIDAEFSGDVAEGYKTLIQLARNQNQFYAKRLYEATEGKWGTDDSELIRIVVSRSEVDLMDICEEFENMYGKTLYEVVEGECSGDYKQTLLSLIKGEFVAKE